MRSYRWMLLFTVLALPVTGQERGLKRVSLSTGGDASLYAHSYALVVGVQSYAHWDRLINPLKDAHEVGSALKQQGFEVTYLDDPDAEGLRAGLQAFAYGKEGQDEEARLVVFFAGHGHTEKVASGNRGFILPRDAPRPETDRVGFMSTAVSMDFIRELARGMLAKHVLFIFDSCFSGTLLRGTAHPEPITRKTTRKVRQFITSGSADEQVPDVSVFKASLLNALDGDADQTKDGYVTGEELGWYLKGRVMEYTRGAQTPQYGKINDPNLDQGDIVFMPESGGSAPPAEPVKRPAVPTTNHLSASRPSIVVPNSRSQEESPSGEIEVHPGDPISFGEVILGDKKVKILVITNVGDRKLQVRANSDTREMGMEPASFILEAGQATTSRVYFAPAETGDRSGQIRLVDDKGRELTTSIQVQGKGKLGK